MKAVVLAGGKSSRMGQDKALMMLGGKTVIDRVLDTVSSVFDEVYISGNCSHYPVLSKGIIEDHVVQKGPMGGIYSALEYCKEDLFVCSCDMPFISSELIREILQKRIDDRISVMNYHDKIYPVLGVYPYSVIETFRNSISNDHLRMTSLLEDQSAFYIQSENNLEDQLLNINTPENFRKAEIIVNKFL